MTVTLYPNFMSMGYEHLLVLCLAISDEYKYHKNQNISITA